MPARSVFMVAAPASHQGKTLVTAALLRRYRNLGLRVAAFKAGPDYLDPMLLARACGRPVDNLDLWMAGEAGCRRLLAEAAAQADVVVVEGVMGLSDGTPSSADLARALGLPVVLLVDAGGRAQGFAGAVLGCRALEPDLRYLGVLANRVAGARHEALVRARLPADFPWLGAVPRAAELTLPERHLGLVQAAEVTGLEEVLERAAAALGETALAQPPPCPWTAEAVSPWPLAGRLRGLTVAVARDAAFAFLYPANLRWLEGEGARLRFFSPLADEVPPPADAVWLPGGYPELHVAALARAEGVRRALRAHRRAGGAVVAECGGMLYLLERLRGPQGEGAMLGLLAGRGWLTPRLQGLGWQAWPWAGEVLRGHTFHYARAEVAGRPRGRARRHPDGAPGEWIHGEGPCWASFMHLYFPSAPEATAALFRGDQWKR